MTQRARTVSGGMLAGDLGPGSGHLMPQDKASSLRVGGVGSEEFIPKAQPKPLHSIPILI